MKGTTRRNFIKGALFGGIAVAASSRRVLGANDDINVACVGLHGRGGSHIREFQKIPGVRVLALCDVDRKVLEQRAKGVKGARKYVDVRKLLDDKDIDAVSIATPNHSHSLITFWACQAGKDVYVEKPCSHNVFEGRKIVEAARKYGRIVQHGTQSRASLSWARQAAAARSGKYGKLLVAKGYCCKPRWSIGWKPYQNPPQWLDFNLWLGPAPNQPYHANLVHYNWHWFWDFGNGDIGNQGVHQMDIARWGIGKTLPRAVLSLGGRYVNEPGFKDQGQTPNQLVSIFDFGDCLLLFETRGLVGRNPKFPRIVTNEFYTDQGVIKDDKFYPKSGGKPVPLEVEAYVQPGGIFRNFITCVRSRKRSDLVAEILEGHYSSALCHLGNISYRMGVEQKFEKPQKLDFSDNKIVGDSIMTMLENTRAIGVNVENATLRVGPKLFFDPEKERFVDNPTADMLLTREYREPFVVPEKV